MLSRIYLLKCITNLHVGNGDVNYNIIDNEVEKDSVLGCATINASGIKGALREYFVKNNLNNIIEIFGDQNKQGKIRFLNASLLAAPFRTTLDKNQNKRAYYLTISESSKEKFIEFMNISKELKKNEIPFEDIQKATDLADTFVENIKLDSENSMKILGNNIYVIDDKDFANVDLPVVARNHLENGISVNLFYEEIVPHESLFYLPVFTEECNEELLNDFENAVVGNIVQFGGNASIGYGLCKISKIQ